MTWRPLINDKSLEKGQRMSVWRKFAFTCLVCSPAMSIVAGLASAVETDSGSVGVSRVAHEVVLAQDAVATEPHVTPEDAKRVSPEVAAEEWPAFTEEYMKDPANIEAGKVVWETCAGCHGSRAYPGKGPMLEPKKYTSDFVFHQATFGSKNGKMPPFGEVFTREERMAVVSWVLSKDFAP